MVQQLPREHFHLIYYIISLSSRIQKHADTNMMNPEALAIVLAPVCTGLENNLKDIPSWVKRNPRGSNTSRMIYDMNHLIEANTKWTGIWTRMIEHSEQLLGCWKDSLWQGGVYNTVPCHPSYSASGVLSNPSRHSTSLSRLHHGSELFDIVPPLCGNTNYYTTHYEGNDQKANVAELYRVVALRSNSSKRHYRQRSDSKSHIDCPRASNSTSTMGMSTQSSIYPSSILTTASSNITSCMDWFEKKRKWGDLHYPVMYYIYFLSSFNIIILIVAYRLWLYPLLFSFINNNKSFFFFLINNED
jgi:hypothetical protein